MAGDYQPAIEHSQRGVEISMDPFYSIVAKTGLAQSYMFANKFLGSRRANGKKLCYSAESLLANKIEITGRYPLSLISLTKGEAQALTTAEELDT